MHSDGGSDDDMRSVKLETLRCRFVLSAATCRDDLGMNSGAIPDYAINASSSYDFKSVGPQNSRSVRFVRRQ